MSDSNDIEKAIDACFNPLRTVYLLHVVIGFHDYYFCFHTLETVDTFIKMFRTTFVESISDSIYKMRLEILTEAEYEERLNKKEGTI